MLQQQQSLMRRHFRVKEASSHGGRHRWATDLISLSPRLWKRWIRLSSEALVGWQKKKEHELKRCPPHEGSSCALAFSGNSDSLWRRVKAEIRRASVRQRSKSPAATHGIPLNVTGCFSVGRQQRPLQNLPSFPLSLPFFSVQKGHDSINSGTGSGCRKLHFLVYMADFCS